MECKGASGDRIFGEYTVLIETSWNVKQIRHSSPVNP